MGVIKIVLHLSLNPKTKSKQFVEVLSGQELHLSRMAEVVKELTVMKKNGKETNEGLEIGLVKENEDTMQIVIANTGEERNEGHGNPEKELEPQNDRVETRPKIKGHGRAAFFSYMNIKCKEMNAKVDKNLKASLSEKWKAMDPSEKAQYKVPRKEKAGEQETIFTRCSPERFTTVVSTFSKERLVAVNEMGFGLLVKMTCHKLHRSMCRALIDRFDPSKQLIRMHGKVLEVNSHEFERIMGLKDNGTVIDLSGDVSEITGLRDGLRGKNKKIWIRDIQKQLLTTNNADESFKVLFGMFALGTILCPSTSQHISSKFLLVLKDIVSISSKNWAALGLKHLINDITTYKENSHKYVTGCVMFLQLFYYDCFTHEYCGSLITPNSHMGGQ